MVDEAAFQLARPLLCIGHSVLPLWKLPLRENGTPAPDHNDPDADEIMHINTVTRRTQSRRAKGDNLDHASCLPMDVAQIGAQHISIELAARSLDKVDFGEQVGNGFSRECLDLLERLIG